MRACLLGMTLELRECDALLYYLISPLPICSPPLFHYHSTRPLPLSKQLLNWLRKQKEQGYAIVGVEQTSSSIPLSSHTFSDKTVLLLGKEKEGIPVEFLQVVDVCVEIPQFGVIRSLNVHVTGALCIWEYTCQMMEQQSSRSRDLT